MPNSYCWRKKRPIIRGSSQSLFCLLKLADPAHLMKHLFQISLSFFLLSLFSISFVSPASAEIKIGILAKRGANRVISQWGATGSYLTEKLGEQVVIIPIKFALIETMVKHGRIDFLLANSAFFVEMETKYQVRPIATMINAMNNKPITEFGGVIFTRKESTVQELEDIRNKSFMMVKFSSFGGGQMAWRLLLDNNIDPQTETTAFLEAGTHDRVVHAVQKGIVDVGTVRTDTLERMQSEGKININEFRIIHPIEDDFHFVRSTRLYPEWPMAALTHTSPELSKRVAKALQEIAPESTAAKNGRIVGWITPADYSSVRQCLKTIRYGAFAP